MDATPLLGSLSIAGLLAACWFQLRTLAAKVASIAFVRVKIHYPLCDPVASYFYKHFARSPFGLLTYSAEYNFVRPLKRHQLVGFECPSREPMIFWQKWRPILLSAMPPNSQGNASEGKTVTVTALRGLFDMESILRDALQEHAEENSGDGGQVRFRVMRYGGRGNSRNGESVTDSGPGAYGGPPKAVEEQRNCRLLGWKKDDIGPALADGKALDTLAYPPSVSTLVQELRHWRNSADWYRQRAIPWRRGWLLYGAPGTGKTSLVRAIAQDFDLPVCVLDLSTMCNREMQSSWSEVKAWAPCIALIEDIDAVFDGRENIAGENAGGLTFDCLLNCLSGIEGADGVFLVITTNHPEKLDDALGAPRPESNGTMISTRPGRVDRALELTTMDEACRRQLATRILSDCPEHIKRLVHDGSADTPAQFQERCAQLALAEHWKQ